MTTTIEPTPQQVLEEWQAKLLTAQQALIAFEQVMGRLALAGETATSLVARLQGLRAEVQVAEAAVTEARKHVPDPRIAGKQNIIAATEAALAEHRSKMEYWGQAYDRTGNDVSRNNLSYHVQQVSRCEDALAEHRRELKALQTQVGA